MIKSLYLCSMDFNINDITGESKKVKEQVSGFKNLGIDITLFEPKYQEKSIRKILRRLPFYPEFGLGYWKQLQPYITKEIDFIYIRMSVIDRGFISLLKKIKQKSSKTKIVLEIPTYPYEKEWTRFIDIPFVLKDRLNRSKLKKYIDMIVTPASYDEIYGISTISINNAINVKHFYIKEGIDEKKITFIGVAHVRKCHGFDRVIKGLKLYYESIKQGEPEVHFCIAGDGEEINNLIKLTRDSNVEPYVHFLGKVTGNELEAVLEKSNLAIGTLAPHRINLKETRSLKHREYCAEGVPFIYAGEDIGFPEDFKFAMRVPDNGAELDIKEIVDFYLKLNQELGAQEIVSAMQAYAKKSLSWDTEMKKVIEGLHDENL